MPSPQHSPSSPLRPGRSARRLVAGAAAALLAPLLAACPMTAPDPEPDPAFSVGPARVILAASVGDSDSATLTITNDSDAGITVTLQTDDGWIALGSSSETIATGAEATVAVATTCTSEITGSGSVALSDGTDTVTIAVDRLCTVPTATTAAPAFLVGTAGDTGSVQQVVTVNSTVIGDDFTVADDADWLEVTPASGTAGGTLVTLTLEQSCGADRAVASGTVTVTFGDGSTVTFDVFRVCAALPAGTYDVRVEFSGEGFTTTSIGAFLDAAERWEEIIVGDVADAAITTVDLPGTPGRNDCFPDGVGPVRDGESVEDILIDARVVPIDGSGAILGAAGPCIVRDAASSDPVLTVYGTMLFDSADVDDLIAGGTFDEVILHEMGHVLGIGTLWDDVTPSLLAYEPAAEPCRTATSFTTLPTFTGSEAVASWIDLGGAGDVPVEDQGGAGTQCGHWDEETFDTELMTGFLNGASQPLADLTIASLQDLGYDVDRTAADPFTLPACSPACLRQTGAGIDIAAREILLPPRFEIGPDGTVRELNPDR